MRAGRFQRATKQELIDTLYDFLLGLIPLEANAVLIIDEAQDLPLPLLEQIRILSNLETDKDKLLQIILVGQLDLQTMLRSPELRQLDQRVSIRYELKPLDREAVGAYVTHRLAIAGGSASVTFTTKALDQVHRLSDGIPRLINLICDRALLAGFSARRDRISPDMVIHAAESLDVQTPVRGRRSGWLQRRRSASAAAATVLLSAGVSTGASAYIYQRLADMPVHAASRATITVRSADVAGFATPVTGRGGIRSLPAEVALTVLVGQFPAEPQTAEAVQTLTDWVETFGLRVYYCSVGDSPDTWQRVLAGAYTDRESVQRDADRLNRASPTLDARVVSADEARRARTEQ